MFRSVVVLLAVASVAFAALQISPLKPKPDKFKNVEGCYLKDNDEVIPFGSSAPCKHHCMEYRCNKDYVQIVTCGVGVAIPPCKLVENKDKPYPGCCPTIKCP